LELIYVDTEEFSFEEILAKKRGLYGLKFEVEKPVSPIQSLVKPLVWQDENAPPELQSPKDQALAPKVKRSPLQQKAVVDRSPPHPSTSAISPKRDSNDDDIVYMPIRGTFPY
jgi:Mad3/BUB1 homology region 2